MIEDRQTIFALSTATGRAGIAVLRLSGVAALTVMRSLTHVKPKPRYAHYVTFRDSVDQTLIDTGLGLYFPAPHSVTGEDLVEFHIHGSPAVIARFMDVLSKMPELRLANPGEFTRRGLENGKIDLIGVEALDDLLNADTEMQRRVAQEQPALLRQKTNIWREKLISLLAMGEASIDFVEEEDIGQGFAKTERALIEALVSEFEQVLAGAAHSEILRQGFRVVLAGAPNAGKSSLFNALLKREAAIVSEIAGTTRDVLEARLDFSGLPVLLQDTAGLRDETSDLLEIEGMRRTNNALTEADLVLWLVASGDDLPPQEALPQNTILLQSKSDNDSITKRNHSDALQISVKTGQGFNELIQLIRKRAENSLFDAGVPLLTRARQKEALQAAILPLKRIKSLEADDIEMIVHELRQAIASLARLIGAVGVEDVLDDLFARFCIGK